MEARRPSLLIAHSYLGIDLKTWDTPRYHQHNKLPHIGPFSLTMTCRPRPNPRGTQTKYIDNIFGARVVLTISRDASRASVGGDQVERFPVVLRLLFYSTERVCQDLELRMLLGSALVPWSGQTKPLLPQSPHTQPDFTLVLN